MAATAATSGAVKPPVDEAGATTTTTAACAPNRPGWGSAFATVTSASDPSAKAMGWRVPESGA